MNIVDVGEGEF